MNRKPSHLMVLMVLAGVIGLTPFLEAHGESISPDGTLVVSVDTRDGLAWEVTLDGQPLLARSTLGLTFKDGLHLGVHSTILGIERTSHIVPIALISPQLFYVQAKSIERLQFINSAQSNY